MITGISVLVSKGDENEYGLSRLRLIIPLWSPDFDQLVKEETLGMTLEIATFVSHLICPTCCNYVEDTVRLAFNLRWW